MAHMASEVTVFQAIRRGRRVLIPAILLVFIGTLAALLFLLKFIGSPVWYAAFPLVFSLAALILGGSWLNTEWWIWALEHVRNVHELKYRAIANQLMAEDGSWKHKFWFKTPGQKARLAALQYKFNQPDQHEDDPSVPSRTEIGFSKKYIVAETGLFAVLLTGSIYLLAGGRAVILFGLVGLFCLYRIYRAVGNLQSGDAPLEISVDGIRIRGAMRKWDDVMGINEPDFQNSNMVVFSKIAEEPDTALSESIRTDNLLISNEKLAHLLKVYQIRHEQKRSG